MAFGDDARLAEGYPPAELSPPRFWRIGPLTRTVLVAGVEEAAEVAGRGARADLRA